MIMATIRWSVEYHRVCCFLGFVWVLVLVLHLEDAITGPEDSDYGLEVAVVGPLTPQIVFLGLMALLNADDDSYSVATLAVFLCALCSAMAGEGILVIRPIAEALDAGGKCSPIPRDGGHSGRSWAEAARTPV